MITKDQLYNLLNELKIQYQIFNHPPIFTAEEGAILAKHIPGAACKNLFLKDSKKRFWLIIACADTKIELKKLSKQLSAPELRFGNPESLFEHLGVLPGSVTPFGLLHQNAKEITVIVDKKLQEHSLAGFHPLENTATVVLSPIDLINFIQSCGNSIVFVDFNN